MVEKEQLEKMPEIVNDAEGEVIVEELIDTLERDIVAYEKQLGNLDKELENYEAQLKIDEELWDLLSDRKTYKRLKIDWEFENNERYWDLQFQKHQYKLRQAKAQAYGTRDGIKHEIEVITADYEDKKQKLKELKEGDDKNE